MASKAEQIIEMVESDESLTQKEMAERSGATEGYVSKVVASLKKHREAAEDEQETTDIEGEVSSFVKRVKITPDKDVLTEGDGDTKEEDEEEEYQCSECGHTWTAGRSERQDVCPKCGCEFE